MAVMAPTATPPNGGTKQQKQVQQPNPFTRASKRLTEPFADLSRALSASAQTLEQQDVPAQGYLRFIVINVTVSGTTGATYLPDAPYNVLESVQLTDVNGQPIVLLSGYDLYIANAFGGYAQNGDPKNYPGFSQSATGFSFQLRIPVEIVQRNALGALPNMNAAMTYKVKVSLAPIDDVYATNGTGATANITMLMEAWAQPMAADLNGVPNTPRPPHEGTTQNWSEYVKGITVGQNTVRMTRVGNVIRNLVFINRDASGDRTDTGIPVELRLLIDGKTWRQNSFAYEQQRIFELYGYGAGDRPAGVWILPLTDDFDGTPGEEMGDYWLATTGATRLELQATWTAAGSLMILTNDILAFAGNAGNGGAGQTLGSEG
jgi:hypothetical protein